MDIRTLLQLVRNQLRSDEGQTMTEYGVLLALITVGVIGVLAFLGPKIVAAFQAVLTALGG